MPFGALSVTAGIFLLLGIAYLAAGIRLPFGTSLRPGAGLFPLVIGISLTTLSAIILVSALRKREESSNDQEPFPQGEDRRRVAAVAVTLILFVILVKPLGYVVSSALLMAATFRLLGLRSWGKIIPVSILTAALSYYFFESILGMALPHGIFFS
ncbi:MAG TPA: tripartite tricarboxylate transporter TctB family protein [Thermodesulfobacteriota bacterium]|nr:tripartite tricarboxylate transporter TctB family protein [Thermodesulfobacteriota bacterium]